MGIAIEKNGFTDLLALGFEIVNDLAGNGFEVVAVDKVATNNFSRINSHYVLRPTLDVDPLCAEENQPWRLVLEFSNSSNEINVWVVTPLQLDTSFDIAEYDKFRESGRLFWENASGSDGGAGGGGGAQQSYSFFSRDKVTSFWSCFAVGQDATIDYEAVPMSYQLNISDHGIFLSTWAESYDRNGDCFNWFCIQRPVDCQTGLVIVDGKAPLMCIYSQWGNNDITQINDINVERNYLSVQYFTVRENDISMPEPPTSAVIPTRDSFPLINPLQQIALSEDGNFQIRFVQGFSTARYIYDYKLDMIAYTSADVLSQWSQPSFNIFGEATQRTYKALNANFPNNTGMRILAQVGGIGIDERPEPPENP